MLTALERLLLEQVELARANRSHDAGTEARLLIMLGLAHVYADRDRRKIDPYYTRDLVEIYFNTEVPPHLKAADLYQTVFVQDIRTDANRLFKQATSKEHLEQGVKQISDKLDLVQNTLDQNAEKRASPSRQIFWNVVGGGVVGGLTMIISLLWGKIE
jgi:hypothetical protein